MPHFEDARLACVSSQRWPLWSLLAVCALLASTPTASAQCGGNGCCDNPLLCSDKEFCDGGVCGCEYASPIIIDTTGEGFHLTSAKRGVVFDIAANGHPIQMAWTAATSHNAFLALDRNGNGKIDNGKELFGNFTDQPPCPDGGHACRNGFRALAEFDKPENGGTGDGIIDERDAVFSQLRLWIDENHDGISQPNELYTLPQLGVFSLALKYRESKRTDKFGNEFRYKAAVNPQPPNEDSADGRWMFDLFFMTTGRDKRAMPAQVEGLNPAPPPCDDPPVPTSATVIDNVKQTYSNQAWSSCDGSEKKSNQYGYQRCVTYQVKDQNGADWVGVLGISEVVAVVDQNINTNMSNGNSSTNAAGQFLDDLALLSTATLPTNACSIIKQSFTATGNDLAIRVNCLQYNSTDVTITDVTSNPASCSKPTYHCN